MVLRSCPSGLVACVPSPPGLGGPSTELFYIVTFFIAKQKLVKLHPFVCLNNICLKHSGRIIMLHYPVVATN